MFAGKNYHDRGKMREGAWCIVSWGTKGIISYVGGGRIRGLRTVVGRKETECRKLRF